MAPAWTLLQPLSLTPVTMLGVTMLVVTMLGVSPVLGTLRSGPPRRLHPRAFRQTGDSVGHCHVQ